LTMSGRKFRRKGVEDGEDTPAPVRPPPKAAAPKLSFNPDEEGAPIKIKKKKRKDRSAPPLPGDEEPQSELGTQITGTAGTGAYTAERLAELRAASVRSPSKTSHDGAREGSDQWGEETLPGEVPDGEAVRAARAQRERLRRMQDGSDGRMLSGPDGVEYIPLDPQADEVVVPTGDGAAKGVRGSRLVREDQEQSDDETSELFEDQRGRRLGFGKPMGRGNWQPGPGAAQTVVEVDDDAELAPGQVGPTRCEEPSPLTATPTTAAGSSTALASCAARICSTSKTTELQERLEAEAKRLTQQLVVQEREEQQSQKLLEESGQACGELEEEQQRDMKAYEFLQRAQAYAEDLLDCLNAKAARIEELEETMCESLQIVYDRRRAVIEAIEAARRALAARA